MATYGIETSPSELWDDEYRRGGIPSSVRDKPSRVLVEFLESEFGRNRKGYALDIGCGGGRNAFFLAEQGFDTTAFDYSKSQIEAIQSNISIETSARLHVFRHDVATPWPIPDSSIDIASDTFCFKHQIALSSITTYASEITRCLAPGGRFMLFFATRLDGYYSQFPEAHQLGPGCIITDPGNGIRSRLYEPSELTAVFPGLVPLHQIVKAGVNAMHGAMYERESCVIYFEKA